MAEYPFVELVHAIDYSPKTVDRANETYGHPKVSRWVSELETFIAPVQYDLVVSFNVLEHLHNPDEYFEAAFRLCEKHGHVAIITPNRNRLSNLIRRARRQPQLLCDQMHYREYSLKDLQTMGASHGLLAANRFGHTLGIRVLAVASKTELDTWLGSLWPFMAEVIGIVFVKR